MLGQEDRIITVNQIGYPAFSKKVAMFKNQIGAFKVVDENTSHVVYEGELTKPVDDKVSGTTVSKGDFSSITQPGRYRIEKEGACSASFVISEGPYQDLHRGLFKAFYFLRCGMELTEEFAESWGHKACHMSKGIVHGREHEQLDSCGGWHDAGDYGKYTVAGAKAIADLLLAYERYPSAFLKPIPLPETDGITPDVLHECRYELEWLFKMQEVSSGGVFHKLTTLQFPGLDVMPEDDNADLYFSPISATATASFAAIMAMAARIYKNFDEEFAQKCLQASHKAWEWLQVNPNVAGFKNPPEIATGEYGDPVDLDERYWAAGELYRTTGNQVFHDEFIRLSGEVFDKNALGWTDVGGYGTIAYLLNGQEKANEQIYTNLKRNLVEKAQQLVEVSQKDGFGISLEEHDYVWGSNMVVMNNGMLLLLAYHLTDDKRFEDCALEHVHYLIGRNALDISYVTGFGDKSVLFPHHRPSVGDNVIEPVPGLVSGGPDRGLNDPYVKEHLQGRSAAQSFVDHEESYSTNEVTIYWNSPAVFVLSHWVK